MGRALFMFVCRIVAAITVIIMQVALARWMGAEQLGIYIYAFAWCVLLAAVAGRGLPDAADVDKAADSQTASDEWVFYQPFQGIRCAP